MTTSSNNSTMTAQIINESILQKATQILSDHFKEKIAIKTVEFLSEPERRNVVLRLILNSSESKPQTAILKQSLAEESDADDKEAYARFARDWAGLEFASQIPQNMHNVPRFYGGNREHRFILIEDLGQKHISLVDTLTQPSRNKAILALQRFMKALGGFHAASFGHTPLYETLLRKIHPQADSLQDDLNFYWGELLVTLKLVTQKLNFFLSEECISEAQSLVESLLKPNQFTVLTHGDICPDNVFDHEDSRDLQLIDFEWAFVRNALLDGTYLRMSMPTCWCAKAIPDDIIDSLEQIYREELKRVIPAAKDDLTYTKAYTEACGFWLLQQTLPYLDSVLDQDRVGPSGPVPEDSLWKAKENWGRPRVLTRLQAFIAVASGSGLLPHLKQMAEALLLKVKKHWPEVQPLEYYPAFHPAKFYIRRFKAGDERDIYQLFYDTVHTINRNDYTEEQVNIWAPEQPDLSKWNKSLTKNHSFVAIDKEKGKIIGFSDMENNGYLNRGYVHKDYQRQGIGKALLLAREERAKELSLKKLFADVSITAKPFFEKHGYIIEKEQIKELGGALFTNYKMVKKLGRVTNTLENENSSIV